MHAIGWGNSSFRKAAEWGVGVCGVPPCALISAEGLGSLSSLISAPDNIFHTMRIWRESSRLAHCGASPCAELRVKCGLEDGTKKNSDGSAACSAPPHTSQKIGKSRSLVPLLSALPDSRPALPTAVFPPASYLEWSLLLGASWSIPLAA